MRLIQIVCLLFLFLPLAASSQQQTAPMSEETKKMMEAWMKLSAPGEPHKQLMTLAGNYSITSKSRFDSASEFMQAGGTCEKKAVSWRSLHPRTLPGARSPRNATI
jgi:hypothetical protein